MALHHLGRIDFVRMDHLGAAHTRDLRHAFQFLFDG